MSSAPKGFKKDMTLIAPVAGRLLNAYERLGGSYREAVSRYQEWRSISLSINDLAADVREIGKELVPQLYAEIGETEFNVHLSFGPTVGAGVFFGRNGLANEYRLNLDKPDEIRTWYEQPRSLPIWKLWGKSGKPERKRSDVPIRVTYEAVA